MFATLTSKGQLTLPKPARDALDLKAGQQFVVEVSAAGSVVLTPQRADARSVGGLIKSPFKQPLSVQKMDAGIAQHLRAKHAGAAALKAKTPRRGR